MYDEEPDHAHSGPAGGGLVVESINVLGEDDSDDEMARSHADSTHCKNWLAAGAIDPENGWDGGDEHDDADDAGSEEAGGCLAEAQLVEDLRGVVENLWKGSASSSIRLSLAAARNLRR